MVKFRRLRRKISRTRWTAWLLGIQLPAGEADRPGLILVQVDGLARSQLERALAKDRMPFLEGLIRRKHFTLEDFYSGVPSTTPAVQAEIFYGVKCAVPSFEFFNREAGKLMRMYEPSSAEEVESRLAEACSDGPLLKDGRSYSNIYRAGAESSHYCSGDFAPSEIFKHLSSKQWIGLMLLHAPALFRIVALALLELGLAIVDSIKGLRDGEDTIAEIRFIPARVVICLMLREMLRIKVRLDIESGVQTIHANFLGYDEQAHRRGPGSAFAHWTLKGIDRTIRDFYRAAQRCDFRDYEIMIYSDHGQESANPYAKRNGREIDAALAAVFSKGSLAGSSVWMSRVPEKAGNVLDSCRSWFGLKRPPGVVAGTPDPDNHIIVSAMGPIAHVYLPVSLSPADMRNYACGILRDAGVPLVLWKDSESQVHAVNPAGTWELPRDRVEILGENHPFLDEAARDLVSLVNHPNAGNFILSGWNPRATPLSFPPENGAHGGPGREETRGFLLIPDRIRRWHASHLAQSGTRVRGEDLRRIALHYLDRDIGTVECVPEAAAACRDLTLRVMTYNIHSCIGLDGKVRPERIARVINHFEPDLVAVQEVDAHRPRSREEDQAARIAEHLRLGHVFHAMLEEEKERYGIAMFANRPFQIVKTGYLTPAEPRLLREARGAIWVETWLGGTKIHFINTHFGLGNEERRRQVETLLGPEWLGAIPDNEPVILTGDFNSGPGSGVFKRLSSRFRDAQQGLPSHRPMATFSSLRPLLRIDHVFISRHSPSMPWSFRIPRPRGSPPITCRSAWNSHFANHEPHPLDRKPAAPGSRALAPRPSRRFGLPPPSRVVLARTASGTGPRHAGWLAAGGLLRPSRNRFPHQHFSTHRRNALRVPWRDGMDRRGGDISPCAGLLSRSRVDASQG
jgi:endonuclease/exonuclease/phosphatase family metal-dependent hydrolase